MPEPDARNPWLDGVRALAIGCVLVGHSTLLMPHGPRLQRLLLLGYVGVEIFFVLSGFLIGTILWRMTAHFDAQALRHFWLRRWLRTLPNYFLFLALAALLAALGWRDTLPAQGQLWQYALFVQNLAWRHPDFFPEAWSLAVEEVFYFSLPLLALWLCRIFKLRASSALARILFSGGGQPVGGLLIMGAFVLGASGYLSVWLRDLYRAQNRPLPEQEPS